MEKDLFNDLVQSLKEARNIAKGKVQPSRQFNLNILDVKAARSKVQLSQNDFAQLMHVSTKTLQNWEQQRRKPSGPALALLKIITTAPKMAIKALQS